MENLRLGWFQVDLYKYNVERQGKDKGVEASF